MIMNSRGKDVQAKQEGETTDSKIPKASSTSRQWGGFKNPRIVRVSRAFGGKDRHSKVCTIRGLRDRRIRLSVPTAIQLYDLQERLGLSQPSKVVDWLLDATKNEIDKLPPLQMPPGNFSQFHQPALFSKESIAPQASLSHFFNANSANMKDGGTQAVFSSREGIDINDHVDGNDQTTMGRSRYWNSEAAVRAKCKEAERETAMEKDKWNVPNEQGNLENLENFGGYVPQLSAQNFFPAANQSSFPALLNNALPYNTYLHWEPPNLSLSQFGNHSFTFQAEDSENNHSLALPSQVAISSGSQLYFCPSVTTVPSIIPPYPPYMNTSVENEARQINHLQVLSSSSQHVLPNSLMPTLHLMSSPMKSFASNASPKLPPQENDDSQLNKGDSGS